MNSHKRLQRFSVQWCRLGTQTVTIWYSDWGWCGVFGGVSFQLGEQIPHPHVWCFSWPPFLSLCSWLSRDTLGLLEWSIWSSVSFYVSGFLDLLGGPCHLMYFIFTVTLIDSTEWERRWRKEGRRIQRKEIRKVWRWEPKGSVSKQEFLN